MSLYNQNIESLDNTGKQSSIAITNTVPLVPRPPPNEPTANLSQPTYREKTELVTNPAKYYVKFTFMITYVLLLTTATITFVEAMRTPDPEIRHVLNLETCISIVAGYFYSVFISQLDETSKQNKDIDWSDITRTRYIDWSITTPLMLLVLCVVLASHSKATIYAGTLVSIVGLNYAMLFIGYLGETGALDRWSATWGGFIPFFAMFYIIYYNFVGENYSFANYVFYGIYLVVWSLYGVVYLLSDEYKNIATNILDCISKCLIGNGLWLYYSQMVKL